MTEHIFTEDQKMFILRIARESGGNEIRKTKQQNYSKEAGALGLTFVPGGTFVTYKINGQLRGCIGCFSPHKPFYELVQEYAIEACKDYRFRRMKPVEFDNTTISVSCLSKMEEIKDPLKTVIAGKHGIYVEYGQDDGTFLPQVATEQKWDTKTFCLECAYNKAGISRSVDVFNNPNVHWSIYTATIVSE
ncbi:AMMECR1 domain containing protein [Entamoeba invadens IP1]|uniref:AMMECR1 domain containing protein n=1 Tax=Entamoeba invadens IP1 TaxID=370355 RepID=A0A0A1U676_ENTIV|nr:AMMECR1 domain containing protein [Entamoeba invadens IP1]ELP88390.1 AMMECR1 domain containing protein [Entamoeba invadens IP1]|eukprot:XP_004255161.1 AMMECR1 domain containing protein [Entamoeba invadens IP1]